MPKDIFQGDWKGPISKDAFSCLIFCQGTDKAAHKSYIISNQVLYLEIIEGSAVELWQFLKN